MSIHEKYQCDLDEASLKKAKKELGENPHDREDAVKSLRKWVEDNSSWLKCPTDTKFLLMFLRVSKFTQLAARKRLVKYWTTRTRHKEWFENIDTKDKKFVEAFKQGNFMVLPERDSEGRSVWLIRPACIDVTGKISFDEMMRSGMAVADCVSMDENVTVNGAVLIQDSTDLTLKHQTFMGLERIRGAMDSWINAFALRYKAVHYYNTNPVFEALFTIMRPIMPAKLQKRLHFHGKNLANVYKYVDKGLIPHEYVPDDYKGKTVGSLDACLEEQLKKLQKPEIRDYIWKLSSSGYGVDEDLKPNDDELFAESFRKLNVH